MEVKMQQTAVEKSEIKRLKKENTRLMQMLEKTITNVISESGKYPHIPTNAYEWWLEYLRIKISLDKS